MMWDDVKQKEFDTLRQCEADARLDALASQRLAALYAELEEEEWRVLGPAMAREQEEIALRELEARRLETQNAVLSALNARQAELVARARGVMHALLAEKALIQNEVAHVLSPSFGATSHEGSRK